MAVGQGSPCQVNVSGGMFLRVHRECVLLDSSRRAACVEFSLPLVAPDPAQRQDSLPGWCQVASGEHHVTDAPSEGSGDGWDVGWESPETVGVPTSGPFRRGVVGSCWSAQIAATQGNARGEDDAVGVEQKGGVRKTSKRT